MMDGLDLIAKATGTRSRGRDALKKDFEAKHRRGQEGPGGRRSRRRRVRLRRRLRHVQPGLHPRPTPAARSSEPSTSRLGLKNAWTIKGDAGYGLATTDVEGLTELGDVQFAYIGNDGDERRTPSPARSAKNAVWKSLPFVKAGNVHRLPDGIWMFGGPESMEAYVDAVVDALTK